MDLQRCRRLPKIELHVHIESALSSDCLLQLHNAAAAEQLDSAGLQERLRCDSLHTFQTVWLWKQRQLRSAADYEMAAASAARSQADDGIIYCEMFFSPFAVRQKKLDLIEVVHAILCGLRSEPRLQAKLIADFTRDAGSRRATWQLSLLERIDDPLLVGVGLGGSEHQFPARAFKRVFERARKHGFHCCAHAGEMAGADSVRSAVTDLQSERIGHATRAVEDATLLTELAERGVVIDACPSSNLQTGVIKALGDFPLLRYREAGIPVTISTDNPIIVGHRLSNELAACATAFDLNEQDLIALQQNAINAAWITHDERTALQQRLDAFAAED